VSKKLTPWFQPEVKPARKGFYERDYGFGDEDIADYWDGRSWWVVPIDFPTERLAGSPSLPWRGLAEKP
jgi:hypothetical protein